MSQQLFDSSLYEACPSAELSGKRLKVSAIVTSDAPSDGKLLLASPPLLASVGLDRAEGAMPTLILSSSYNTESKILRKAAQALNWETFRFEGESLPAWFEHRDFRYAIYCTVPTAFNIASRLNSILLGCSSEWLSSLPKEFTKRTIELRELSHAISGKEPLFIKPALGKSFDAGIRTGRSLVAKTSHLPPRLLVHLSEIVEWDAEYRCFCRGKEVMTLAPYRSGGVTFSSYTNPLESSLEELDAALEFANEVLKAVPCPGGFVLDIGIIKGKGWAVVEPNECWGSGIYGCAPSKVLEVLLAATVPMSVATDEVMKWDYRQHYLQACPHMKACLFS